MGPSKKYPTTTSSISVGCAYAQPIKAALTTSDRRAQLAGAQSELRDASSVLVVGGGPRGRGGRGRARRQSYSDADGAGGRTGGRSAGSGAALRS